MDSIKGTEVIYPIQIGTLPRKQFDAMREMQRRIRLALEEHQMLPGQTPIACSAAPGKA